MNTDTCPCLLRIDLEHAIDKLNFLKEYYLPIIDEAFTSLSVKELTCCLCLINSVLKSIKEGSYVCSNQEVISLYEKKKQIICLLSKWGGLSGCFMNYRTCEVDKCANIFVVVGDDVIKWRQIEWGINIRWCVCN